MFKKKDSQYIFGKRSWNWLKLKKFVEVSAFIIGSVPATPGKAWESYIGAFEVAVMQDGSPVHIASCSAMPLEMRKAATGPDGKLNPDFLNRVIEVRFQQLTSRSNRGRHAVMVRFRDDQSPMDCTIDQPGLSVHLSEVQDEV
jgi:ATP-dependent DNA ligase